MKEDRIIRAMKDLMETMNEGPITASKTKEATITGHTTTAHLLMEIAPLDPVRMTTETEETEDTIITEEEEDPMANTAKAEVAMAITALPMAITALRMEIREIMTVLTSNVLTIDRASRDMMNDQPKLILPLLRKTA